MHSVIDSGLIRSTINLMIFG